MNLFSAKDLKKLGIKSPVKDAQEDEDIQQIEAETQRKYQPL